MARVKRSTVPISRAKELSNSDIYVICCGVEGCTCERKDNRCERGFFSLFIQSIYGIDFAARHNIPYHVGFSNLTYCYSENESDNIWNYYFEQPVPFIPTHYTSTINLFHENYPLLIWDRSHLREMNQHVRQLKFHDSVLARISQAKASVIQGKTLGVHVRRTDHSAEIPPVPLKRYFRVIDKLVSEYDTLFLATDDANVVQAFRSRYGDKLRVNDVIRSDGALPLHRDRRIQTRRELGREVLTDCLCLAACDKLILTFSNVSYAALMFNPDVPYVLLEQPRTTWRRYKTLIVYFLNKWGIRKW
jgi:hypothetical protein